MAGGVCCVAVDRARENRDWPAFVFLLQFARKKFKLRQLKLAGRKANRLEVLAAESALCDAPTGRPECLNRSTLMTGRSRSVFA